MTNFVDLSIKDKKLIENYLWLTKHNLSVYSFSNIYLWKALFSIFYSKIGGNLCIFFKDKYGCFMNFVPLGKSLSYETVDKCFKIMDNFNKNKEISRIENINNNLNFWRKKYELKEKPSEYLYLRKSLVSLKGNKFKHKRASINYFLKNYQFKFMPFKAAYKSKALNLYKKWAKNRKEKFFSQGGPANDIYCYMIDDNLSIHKFILENYQVLDIIGFVIKIDKDIKAYTFGYPLTKDTFCIFAEITDLEIKGLSQFIFWEFCRHLDKFRYINTMDDSGFLNLRQAKLSFHPYKIIPNFIAARNYVNEKN